MSGMAVDADIAAPPLPTLADVKRWARTSKPGDRLVYARGVSLARQSDVLEEVRVMHDRGQVTFTQRREAHGFDYIATRCAEEIIVDPRNRIAKMPNGDDAFDRVMKLLTRCANLKRVCPTNTEIAKACGLKDAEAAKYLIRCAAQRQMIKITDRRPKSRVVRICATGRTTLED